MTCPSHAFVPHLGTVAVAHGQIEMLQKLVERGANMYEQNDLEQCSTTTSKYDKTRLNALDYAW